MASHKKQPAHDNAEKRDDFESVAKRLECDEDTSLFEKRLGKLAKSKAKSPPN